MNINKIKLILLLLPIFAMSGNIIAQNQNNNLFSVTDSQIKQYVEEVYQHETDLVFSDSQRLSDVKDLLNNRILVVPRNLIMEEKLSAAEDLSSVSLLNSNNPHLKRDIELNPKQFNPLKYDLNFYPVGAVMYTVGEKYVLIILPQIRPASN